MDHTSLDDMRQGRDMFKLKKSFKKLESEGRCRIAGQNGGNCSMSNNISINILVSVNINLIM